MCNTCGGKSYHRPNRKKDLKKNKDRCPENGNEKNKESLRCPTRKRLIAKPKKCLTAIEKIMARIQPPIADRERYLHSEHVNCFLEESERIYVKKPAYDPHLQQKPKSCIEGTLEYRRLKHVDSDKTGCHKSDNCFSNFSALLYFIAILFFID